MFKPYRTWTSSNDAIYGCKQTYCTVLWYPEKVRSISSCSKDKNGREDVMTERQRCKVCTDTETENTHRQTVWHWSLQEASRYRTSKHSCHICDPTSKVKINHEAQILFHLAPRLRNYVLLLAHGKSPPSWQATASVEVLTSRTYQQGFPRDIHTHLCSTLRQFICHCG